MNYPGSLFGDDKIKNKFNLTKIFRRQSLQYHIQTIVFRVSRMTRNREACT